MGRPRSVVPQPSEMGEEEQEMDSQIEAGVSAAAPVNRANSWSDR